jgi:hypothetical protein
VTFTECQYSKTRGKINEGVLVRNPEYELRKKENVTPKD